jgi:hypothetical protein
MAVQGLYSPEVAASLQIGITGLYAAKTTIEKFAQKPS